AGAARAGAPAGRGDRRPARRLGARGADASPLGGLRRRCPRDRRRASRGAKARVLATPRRIEEAARNRRETSPLGLVTTTPACPARTNKRRRNFRDPSPPTAPRAR